MQSNNNKSKVIIIIITRPDSWPHLLHMLVNAWLHAPPPIASVGLRLSDEAVRASSCGRLGCKACEPHSCVCVVRQSVHEDSMTWYVAGVFQDNNAIANWNYWMASYDGHSKAHKFRLWKEPVGLTREDWRTSRWCGLRKTHFGVSGKATINCQ